MWQELIQTKTLHQLNLCTWSNSGEYWYITYDFSFFIMSEVHGKYLKKYVSTLCFIINGYQKPMPDKHGSNLNNKDNTEAEKN